MIVGYMDGFWNMAFWFRGHGDLKRKKLKQKEEYGDTDEGLLQHAGCEEDGDGG